MDLCRVLFRCWCFLILFDSSASLRNYNNLRKRNPDNRPTILLQDDIQNKSNFYNNRNLQSRKQFEIHRHNKPTNIRDVHRKNINKNYYKSDRKNPTWTMLDALLSGFPEIEEVHLNINDIIHHPSSDLSIDLPKSTDLDAPPDLNFLLEREKPTEKPDWELITNAPKSSHGPVHRRPQVQHNSNVSFKDSNLDADDHHYFSSSIVPTTSKQDNQVLIKPFWGRPISELSPKHFMFQKGSNNNNHQTTSAITTSTSSPITSTPTLTSSTPVEDANEDEEGDDYSDDDEQQGQSQVSEEEDKTLKDRISTEYQIKNHHKHLIKAPLKTYHSVPVIPPMQRVDFGPIFLALIPIALALGAAASLALTSAVQPNQAIAMAQQQQQQQSENSNSNNNQNSNSALLESLAIVNSLNKGGSSGHQYPPILILGNNGTVAAFPEGKRRRKKR